MNNEKSPEIRLADKIKAVSNILVTVSHDPSVDELATALALTFMLDRLGKHTTAVFSGAIPPAINFLEPEKTFESNADSLRDFIISLDKEKADRLRYKIEGDLVKVFITPYKTKITADDLKFEEGDFNVELVIAVGVDKKEDLDEAIAAHGRIFHDAVVATLLLAGARDNLGSISWQDNGASSLAEMVAKLARNLDAKDKNLIDDQIATALLTGVVAATDQFRNDKTTPAVMSLAADLMAKGANQQLIASELAANDDGNLRESANDNIAIANAADDAANDGEMMIGHREDSEAAPETVANSETGNSAATATNSETATTGNLSETGNNETATGANIEPANAAIANPAPLSENQLQTEGEKFEDRRSQDALALAEAQLTETQLNQAAANSAAPMIATNPNPATAETSVTATTIPATPQISAIESRPESEKLTGEPTFTATLDATTVQAEEDAAREASEESKNHTILSHETPVDSAPVATPTAIAQEIANAAPIETAAPTIAPIATPTVDTATLPTLPTLPNAPIAMTAPTVATAEPTISPETQLDNLIQQSQGASSALDDLRAAVNEAANATDASANFAAPTATETATLPRETYLQDTTPAAMNYNLSGQSDDGPTIEPFATTTLPPDGNTVVAPPDASGFATTIASPTANAIPASDAAIPASPTDFGLPLPPPPPLPPMGAMPTMTPDNLPPLPAMPTMPTAAPNFAAPTDATALPPLDPSLPVADAGADDPTQYHIPGQ